MKILFICTHNRCRSILAEAITNHLSNGRIIAKSAGSQASGEVHPLTIKYLKEAGINTQGLQSESWDKYESFQPDVVITVCDSAQGEQCPLWFGKSIKVHWGLEDPSKLLESEEITKAAFLKTIGILEKRIAYLLNFDFENISESDLSELLKKISASDEVSELNEQGI